MIKSKNIVAKILDIAKNNQNTWNHVSLVYAYPINSIILTTEDLIVARKKKQLIRKKTINRIKTNNVTRYKLGIKYFSFGEVKEEWFYAKYNLDLYISLKSITKALTLFLDGIYSQPGITI